MSEIPFGGKGCVWGLAVQAQGIQDFRDFGFGELGRVDVGLRDPHYLKAPGT